MQPSAVIAALQKHRHEFARVVPLETGDRLIPMSFSHENSELTDELVSDVNRFISYVHNKLENANARYGIGGYDEHRLVYRRSELFGAGNEEPRRLHLGVDIWGKTHTAVIAPMDGVVHSIGFNNQLGDYGATIILSHKLDDVSFHTLYGHLSLNSIKNMQPRQTILKGDLFAEFGGPEENGQWPPHLHFQIIIDMEGWEGNYPGVCKYSDRQRYLTNCPDGELILNLKNWVE